MKNGDFLMTDINFSFSIPPSLPPAQWVGAPQLQALSPAHFAITWQPTDLTGGAIEGYVVQYR